MMGAPRAQRYTVIVVAEHARSIRRFCVDSRWFTRSALLLGVLALASAGTLVHYASLLRKRSEDRLLRQENTSLRAQIQAVRDRVEHISSTLDRVERFDSKLRSTVTQLRGPRRALPTGPAGKQEEVGRAASAPTVTGAAQSELPARLALLETAATRQESSLVQLQAYFEDQRSRLESTPAGWPTRGWVSSDFGVRLDPFTAERLMHRGLDIATPPGQSVYAPSDGTVVFAGTEHGYGKTLVLDHGYGLNTRYGHLSAIYVKPGQRVQRGARMAAVGNTGRSTGPHLHYEVRVNGIAENPRKFILQ